MLEIKTLGITASNRSKADFPDGIFTACRADGGRQGSTFNAQHSAVTRNIGVPAENEKSSVAKNSVERGLAGLETAETTPAGSLQERAGGDLNSPRQSNHTSCANFIRNSRRPTHSVQPARRFLESRIRVSTWLSSPASSSLRFFSRLFSSLQTATGTEAT